MRAVVAAARDCFAGQQSQSHVHATFPSHMTDPDCLRELMREH